MIRAPVGEKYSVSNLARGLDVLELLLQHPAGLGVSEIADALDIPKNAAFRVTTALWERGYLVRSGESKSFCLSTRLLTMGYKAANRDGLIEKAMPHMRQLRDTVKETIVISALLDLQGVVLEQVPGVHHFRFVVDAGMTFHLHASAPGKAMLAWLPPEIGDDLIDQMKLTRFNERTITTKQALRQELADVRARGYAVDRAEEMEGVHCVGAPLLDARGYPVSAVNITGPAFRLTETMFEQLGPLVRDCAEKISLTLGFCDRVSV